MVGGSSRGCGTADEHYDADEQDRPASPLEYDLRQILQTGKRFECSAEDLIENRDGSYVCQRCPYPVHRIVGPGGQAKLAITEKASPIKQGEKQEVGSKERKLPQQLTLIQQIDTKQLEDRARQPY